MTFRSFYAACPLSLLNRYKATLCFVFFGIGSSFRVPENLPDSHRHDAAKTETSAPNPSLHLIRSIRLVVQQEVLKREVGHRRHRPDAARNQQRGRTYQVAKPTWLSDAGPASQVRLFDSARSLAFKMRHQ